MSRAEQRDKVREAVGILRDIDPGGMPRTLRNHLIELVYQGGSLAERLDNQAAERPPVSLAWEVRSNRDSARERRALEVATQTLDARRGRG